MSKKTSMNEWVDHLLFEKPIKDKPLKETDIDIENIIQEADADPAALGLDGGGADTAALGGDGAEANADPASIEVPPDKESIPDKDVDDDDIVRQTIKKAREKIKSHSPTGDTVMTLALSLNNQNLGELEIGQDEYQTITNFNIIFNKFGLKYKELPNEINAFKITAQEKVSSADKRNVSIVVEMIDEETFGIQVFIDEDGLRFEIIDAAIKEFDRQYGLNVLDVINQKVLS